MTLTDCKYYVFYDFCFLAVIFYFLLILIGLCGFFIYFFILFIFYLYIIDFYINWIFYFVTAPLNRVAWIHGAIEMLSLLLLLLYRRRQ